MTPPDQPVHVFYNLSLLCLGLVCLSYVHLELNHHPSYMPEICDNAIDDDGDGRIDLNDKDCECPVLEPISLIPNPSFEDQFCCPDSRSQLDCAESWIQASEPTTDYLNTCGWMGWDDFPPPVPFPDGNGIMGFRDGRASGDDRNSNWKEYAGACLDSPLKANVDYRIEFDLGFVSLNASPSISLTFFGTTDCHFLPFGVDNDSLGCPTNAPNWKYLGHKRVVSVPNSWVKSFIDVTPSSDIHAIAIGPPCNATQSTASTYYFFDNLILADLRSFQFKITEINHPCQDEFLLEVPEETDISYQWYKNGIALIGETEFQLSTMQGEGEYQVRILGTSECHITKTYKHIIPTQIINTSVTLCHKETMEFGNSQLVSSGTYTEVLKTRDNCDSTVHLDLTVLSGEETDATAHIFEGEEYQIESWNFSSRGVHQATLMSSLGCDSIININLQYYNVYQPNIFSPNGDGQNDYFTIVGDDNIIEILNLTIFDRWGMTLYKKENLISNQEKGWDGLIKSKLVDSGTYTYYATVLMDDSRERIFKGALLLIR